MSTLKPTSLATALLNAAAFLFTGSCVGQPDEGFCQPQDNRELARLEMNKSQQLQLTSSSGLQFPTEKASFSQAMKQGQLYWLDIRKHTGGDCPHQQLQQVTAADIAGIRFSASPEELYQGAFILARAKACRQESINLCADKPTVVSGFDHNYIVIDFLADGIPQSIDNCSPAKLEQLWPQFQPKPTQHQVIACIKDKRGEELAIEFSYRGTAEPKDRLLLQGIYTN